MLDTINEKREYIRSYDTQSKIRDLLLLPDYAKQPDDDLLNPWSSQKKSYKGEISKFDAMGLQLTSLLYDGAFDDNQPNQQTKDFMQKFLENSIGNSKLNSFLRQVDVRKLEYSDYNTEPSTVDAIARFSYKTRNSENMDLAIDKLKNAHAALDFHKTIKDQNKLSLREIGLASDLAKTLPFLDHLSNSGFLEGNEKLEKMHKNADLANQILNSFKEQNDQYMKEVGPGVIILFDTRKCHDIERKTFKLLDKISAIFSKHGHAAMSHLDKDSGNIQNSHITYSGPSQDDFDIGHQLYSKSYKVNPIALIPKEKHQLLNEIYGDRWQEKIINKFQIIDSEIHTDTVTKFGKLSASSKIHQNISGLADLVPFGHKKLKANDFKKLHNEVMLGEYAKLEKPTMLCSEFCATTIAAGLVELDIQIKQDAKKVFDVNIDIEKEHVVKIPFGKHEDLHKIHPDRLVKILKSHKCVELVNIKDNAYIRKNTNIKEHIKSTATKIGSQISEFVNTKIHRVSVHKSKQQPNSYRR